MSSREVAAQLAVLVQSADHEELLALLVMLEGNRALVRERLRELRLAERKRPDPDEDEWLTPQQAAAYMKVSVKWLSRRKHTLSFIAPFEPRGFRVNVAGMKAHLGVFSRRGR